MTTPVLPARLSNRTGTDESFAWDDAGGTVVVTNASAATLDIPDDAVVNFPIGTCINFAQGGAGTVTVTADGTATVAGNLLATVTAGDMGTVAKVAANSWYCQVVT